jgi:hypothetical protein
MFPSVSGGLGALNRVFFMLRSCPMQSYNWRFLMLRATRRSAFIYFNFWVPIFYAKVAARLRSFKII